MKSVLKWVGIVGGVLLVIVFLAALGGYFASEQRVGRTYDIAVKPLEIPTDAAGIEEGRRLTIIRGCIDCHGEDYGGGVVVEDPALGNIYGANLTTGAGSATAGYSAEDWVRAIRHGIGADGKGLWVMPSAEYAGLSDEDVGLMVAYLQTVPPVDRVMPESAVGLLGRVLVVTNQLPLLAVETINHETRAPKSVTPEVSAEYGAYIVTSCAGCHGADLTGGPIPGAPPDFPLSADLSPGGHLAGWTYEDFANTLRTGVTPEGEQLDPKVMPWPIALEMTDVELEALWLYLGSLPEASS